MVSRWQASRGVERVVEDDLETGISTPELVTVKNGGRKGAGTPLGDRTYGCPVPKLLFIQTPNVF